jgi:hypothetical protein
LKTEADFEISWSGSGFEMIENVKNLYAQVHKKGEEEIVEPTDLYLSYQRQSEI